ncbi:MAG: MptD family putative ECF transporter S component [Oscillochloris sp.]|nr:MptD family putative ECF transporter S component [Oscillochloris sp.]
MKSTSTTLNVRDLVLIGVLTTLMVVIEIVVGVMLMPIMWLALLLGTATSAAFMAPVYMLLAFKVGKRGTFFLVSALRGVFYTLMGWPSMFIIMLPAGLLGELILSSPELYRNTWRVSLAWVVNTAIYGLHGAILIWIFGIQYMANSGQYSAEQIAVMESTYLNPLTVGAVMLLGAALSSLGCWVGAKLLRKHFIKSGLVQVSV